MGLDEINARDREVAEAIEKEYAPGLAASDDLRAVGFAMCSAWDGRGLEQGTADLLVAAEGARSAKTYSAAVHLLRGGYAEQAAMLHRSLFEGMVVAHWATVEPDTAVERFGRHVDHNRLLWNDALRKAGWLDDDDAAAEPTDVAVGPTDEHDGAADVNDAESQARKELDGLFGAHGQHGWTDGGVYTLVGKVAHLWSDGGAQLWQHYRIAYRASNQTLHTSHDALLGTVKADEANKTLLFEHAASDRLVGRALFSTWWAHIQMLALLRDHFDMQACRDELARLTQLPPSTFRRVQVPR